MKPSTRQGFKALDSPRGCRQCTTALDADGPWRLDFYVHDFLGGPAYSGRCAVYFFSERRKHCIVGVVENDEGAKEKPYLRPTTF